MADQKTLKQSILTEYPRLSRDDRFTFHCGPDMDCFNACCRDVSIVLTPYDVLRMKRALRLDSSEFLRRYTMVPFTKEQKIPVVLLKMEGEAKQCPFVTEEGCGIYAHRPWACRMYPLGYAEPDNPNPEDRAFHFLLKEDICHGHGMYYMALYDLDRFRRFVFESRFLELFDVDELRAEVMKTDDTELLEFAVQWLRFSLFGEKTVKVKRSVMEERLAAARQNGGNGPVQTQRGGAHE
ncbi:MAG: YkgJ family cysteine cluster protein [Acidobacteriota bacterium]